MSRKRVSAIIDAGGDNADQTENAEQIVSDVEILVANRLSKSEIDRLKRLDDSDDETEDDDDAQAKAAATELSNIS